MDKVKDRIPLQVNTWYLDFGAKSTFFLILIGFGFIAFYRGGVDYRGYHAAAMLVLRGGNPYDYGQLAPVLEEITGIQTNNPFFYPPWFVLLFLPLAVLPFQAARVIWLAFNVILFYVSVEWVRDTLDWEISGWRRWITYTGVFLTFGVFCLISEQAGILLFFGVALALRSIKYDRPVLAGLGLVIAFTKPQATGIAVIVFGLWMLLKKPKALLWAAAWVVVLTVIVSIAMPKWWAFESEGFGQGLIYQLQGPGQIEFKRVYATVYDFLFHSMSISEVYIYLIAGMLVAAGLILVGLAWFQIRNPVVIAGSAILLTLLVTPYALQYDFVPLIVLVFWLLLRSSNSTWPVRLVIPLLFVLVFSVLIWQEWSYQGYWQVIGILLMTIIVMASEYRAMKPLKT